MSDTIEVCKVEGGIFAGMLLYDRWPWNDGNQGRKIYGDYESHLHGHIRAMLDRKPIQIWNVGCAEGFYAVGIARLTKRPIIVVETAQDCRDACLLNARLNNVALTFSHGLFPILPRSFILMDCEGAERHYLGPLHPIDQCDWIIEVHDFLDEGWGEDMWQRFNKSHRAFKIFGGRDARPDKTFWIVAYAR